MALERQEREIVLNGGMDLKQSTVLQDETTLRSVQNMRWNAQGELEKRATYASEVIPAAPANANYTTVRAEAIFHRGNEVVALTDNFGFGVVDSDDPTVFNIVRGGQAGSTIVPKYSPRACRVSRQIIERTQFGRAQAGVYSAASGVYNGTLVVAWVEIGSAVYLKYKAVDLDSGEVVTPVAQTALGGAFFEVAACTYYEAGKEGVLITYSSGAAAPYTIKALRWDAATKAFSVSSNLSTNSLYQKHTVKNDGSTGKVYLCFTDNTSGFITSQYRTVSTVTTTHTANHGGLPGETVIGSTRVLITSYDATHLKAETFGHPTDVNTMYAAVGTEGFFGTTAALETASGISDYAVLYVNAYDATTQPYYARVIAVSVNFTGTTPDYAETTILPNTWIGCQAFTVDGRVYCGFVADAVTNTASSLLVARYSEHVYTATDRHDVVARLFHDRMYTPDIGVFGLVPNVYVNGTEVFLVVPGDPSEDSVAAYTGKLPQSIFMGKLTFPNSDTLPLPSVEVGGTTLIASGIVLEWDGDTPSEHAPLTRPRLYVDSTTHASTADTVNNLYFRAIYRWVDAQGRLHRSEPSDAYSIGPVTNHDIWVYVTIPPFAAYDGISTLQTIEAELYVTDDVAAPTGYFLAQNGSGAKMVFTSTTTGGTHWVFQGVIAGQAGDPPLYSTGEGGEELVAEPPPAFCSIAVVGDRVWGVDAEDRSRVWYTKPIVAGFAPEWSSDNISVVGDDCIAVSDCAGVPTIFGARGIWQIYAEGPDANGDGYFTPARRLPHEVACIDSLVCRTSIGTVFRGRRGFYLLGSDLSLQPLGLPIDPSTRKIYTPDYTFARVVWDEAHNEIRILDGYNDDLWLYNLIEKKWSQLTQSTSYQRARDMTIADGRIWYLHDNGSTVSVRREYGVDEVLYNISREPWSAQMPYVRMDGVEGYGRLWELVLGIKLSDEPESVTALTVTYEATGPQSGTDTFTWSGADLAALGSSGDVVDLRMKLTHQQCKSFRITITETAGSSYAGSKLAALRLIYGVSGAVKQTRQGALKGAG